MKEYSVRGDLRNPGQFFACCGILYCADRMFENAEGRFDEDIFIIKAECNGNPINEIIKNINKKELKHVIKSDDGNTDSPVYIDSIPIRFDFYNHIDNRYKIKLFTGRETFIKIISRWMDHLKEYNDTANTVNLQDFTKIDVPSGLDTYTSWNALDVGFSLKEQEMKRKSYPLVEFFGHIGVQTYSWSKNKQMYEYRTWPVFLPITVARVVATGAMKLQDVRCFQFYTKKSGKKRIFNRAHEIGSRI